MSMRYAAYAGRFVDQGGGSATRLAYHTVLFRPFVRVMTRNQPVMAWVVMLFPLIFVMFMIIGKLFTPKLYRYAIAEDNLVEYATCFVYLIACPLAMTLAVCLQRKGHNVYGILYWLLASGLFVIAMEEISWGQRIFNIESPGFFRAYNLKDETNFHNASAFPLHAAFTIVAFYGAFSRILLPRSLSTRHPMAVNLLTPHYPLFLYFLATFMLYAYYDYLYFRLLVPLGLEWREFWTERDFVDGKDQEPIELLLSLGFFLFVAVNNFLYRRGQPVA